MFQTRNGKANDARSQTGAATKQNAHDVELVLAARRGDKPAFVEIVARPAQQRWPMRNDFS